VYGRDGRTIKGAPWTLSEWVRQPILSTVAAVIDDDAGYTTFFRDQFPRVVRTVYLMLRDQARAEDVAQDAFVRLYRDWDRIAGYERPDAWVRRVAIRLAMRGRRRDQLWALIRTRLAPQPMAPPDSTRLDVAQALTHLTPTQRAAIALFYYEDRPVAEIALMLGCSESTARVHLFHGRKRLAALLGEEAPDAP
jgi:RNA polymerase sigma-70 factor (ECF subfamily)